VCADGRSVAVNGEMCADTVAHTQCQDYHLVQSNLFFALLCLLTPTVKALLATHFAGSGLGCIAFVCPGSQALFMYLDCDDDAPW
jgi:hypothetical protein